MRTFANHDDVVVADQIVVTACNHEIIEKGERARIVDVDPETRDITLRLKSHHPYLSHQRNLIFLPAAIAALQLQKAKCPDNVYSFSRWLRASIAICVVVTGACLLGWHEITQDNRVALMAFFASEHPHTYAAALGMMHSGTFNTIPRHIVEGGI